MTGLDKTLVEAAIQATLRVRCEKTDTRGSGFVHESGRVITAAHVVHGCVAADLILTSTDDKPVKVTALAIEEDYFDLAVLTPSEPLPGGLKLRVAGNNVPFGLPVAAWGFPAGYPGRRPLLTMGYFAGESDSGPDTAERLYVSGAFNSGNSGGPLVLAETGEVIGVVDAKVLPIRHDIESAIEALGKSRGALYEIVRPDGTKTSLSEGQVVNMVLEYIRSQTQLGIGIAVGWTDVAAFLRKNNVTP